MNVGQKAQGQEQYGKLCVSRHGSRMTKRAANTLEKRFETKVRRQGKKECEEREQA